MERESEKLELFRALDVQETEERIQRADVASECQFIFKYYCDSGRKSSN